MTWNVHGIYNEGKEVKCRKCGKGEMLYQQHKAAVYLDSLKEGKMKVICNKAKNKTCPSPCAIHGKPHDEREDLYGVYRTLWWKCILDGKEYKVRCVKAEVEDEG